MNQNMIREMTAIRKLLSEAKQAENKDSTNTRKEAPVPAPAGEGPMSAKRRAVESKLKNTETQMEEVKQALASFKDNMQMLMDSVSQLTMNVGQIQTALNDPKEGLKAFGERIKTLEMMTMSMDVREQCGSSFLRATLTPQVGR